MSTAPALTIEVRDTAGDSWRLPVAGQRLLVGRTSEAQIRLDRGAVSRRHAEIFRDPFARWWVRDLGSRNGTAVNGVRCSEHLVTPGDIITVGEFFLSFQDAGQRRTDTPAPSAENSVVVRDAPAGELSSLRDTVAPRLAATHLALLSDLGQQLLAMDDPATRMAALCRLMVCPDFQGRCAVVLRLFKTPADEPPRMLCPIQTAPEYSAREPYISRSLLRAILARNEAVLASNAPVSDGRPAAASANLELSLAPEVSRLATVACPLHGDAQTLDILYAILPPECGTSEWLALASLASKQYQQAEGAWAARKISAQHTAIEYELEKARQIQIRLVPRHLTVPGFDFALGFKPCKWVGGDYVDVITTPDQRTVFAIADVCGKGLPAALIASSLHTMVHTNIRAGLPLPDLMRNLNEYLCDTIESGSFVTMFAIEIDPKTGAFECLNAGHPPALLLAPDGTVTPLQSEANYPLGLDRAIPQAQRGVIPPQHLLVLYTDGVTELPTAAGEWLGEDGLAAHLQELCRRGVGVPAAQLAERFTRLLDEIQGDHLSSDDRTFLLARRV